jgi:hypothetical protein
MSDRPQEQGRNRLFRFWQGIRPVTPSESGPDSSARLLIQSIPARKAIKNAIHMGFDGNNAHASNYVLVVVMLAMMVPSAITTFNGMSLFLGEISSISATLGLQLLMFAAAIRMQVSQRYRRYLAVGVFVAALSLSSFFSFSNFLNTNYPQGEREDEYKLNLSKVMQEEYRPRVEKIRMPYEQRRHRLSEDFTNWRSAVIAQSRFDYIQSFYLRLDIERQNLTTDYNELLLNKDNPWPAKKVKKTLRSQKDQYDQAKSDYDALTDSVLELDSVVSKISTAPRTAGSPEIEKLVGSCNDLLRKSRRLLLAHLYDPGSVPFSDLHDQIDGNDDNDDICQEVYTIAEDLPELSRADEFWSDEQNCRFGAFVTWDEAEQCVTKAPLLGVDKHTIMLQMQYQRTLYGDYATEKNIDSSLGLLKEGNTRAFFSLILGLSFDFFILLASLLRMYQESKMNPTEAHSIISMLMTHPGGAANALKHLVHDGQVVPEGEGKTGYIIYHSREQIDRFRLNYIVGFLLDGQHAIKCGSGDVTGIILSKDLVTWAARWIGDFSEAEEIETSLMAREDEPTGPMQALREDTAQHIYVGPEERRDPH